MQSSRPDPLESTNELPLPAAASGNHVPVPPSIQDLTEPVPDFPRVVASACPQCFLDSR